MDIADYTVADTEYWRETQHRLLLKTAYEYNNKGDIQAFPKNLGDWKSYDFKYADAVYAKLDADILLSRAYKNSGELVWMDIINSKAGESFHKQRICVEGQGWSVDNESIAEFRIASSPNPFTKLFVNRLDISKGDKKQVMVYWFLFKKFGSGDAVTMIRLSSPVGHNETETFEFIKSFVEGELFDAMYDSAGASTITVGNHIVREYGIPGFAAIAISVLLPVGIIITGLKRKD